MRPGGRNTVWQQGVFAYVSRTAHPQKAIYMATLNISRTDVVGFMEEVYGGMAVQPDRWPLSVSDPAESKKDTRKDT